MATCNTRGISIETPKLDHSIVVDSPEDLMQVFSTVEEFAGGRYSNKEAIISHESQHADAARLLGQKQVRFLARLVVGAPFTLGDGRRVRHADLTPSALLEDVNASRLGVAVFFASPTDAASAAEDMRKIQLLGYSDADTVLSRAAEYNKKTQTSAYPILR